MGDNGHPSHDDDQGRLDQLDTAHMTYGPNGQIASATNGAGSWKFYYDEDGQRILKTSVVHAVETPVAAYLDDGYLDATGLTRTVEVSGILIGAFMLLADKKTLAHRGEDHWEADDGTKDHIHIGNRHIKVRGPQ